MFFQSSRSYTVSATPEQKINTPQIQPITPQLCLFQFQTFAFLNYSVNQQINRNLHHPQYIRPLYLIIILLNFIIPQSLYLQYLLSIISTTEYTPPLFIHIAALNPQNSTFATLNSITRLTSINYHNKLFKIMKKPNFIDVATSRSLKSQIDLFSKFEVSFLEKYMKCILADQFNRLLINIYQQFFYKKLTEKISKTLGSSLFQTRQSFTIKQLLQGLTDYFREKSSYVSSGQFTNPLKLVYSSRGPQQTPFKQGQLILIDVRIRVQVSRIEQIPQNIQKLLSKFGQQKLKSHDKMLQQTLLSYRGQYLSMIIFYYGDIHFNFNRPDYQIGTISMGQKQFKVRIFVIYVSKIAMFETFRSTNKVNVECINDLVISFYDIKRQKKLMSRNKKKDMNSSQVSVSDIGNSQPKPFDYKLLLGAGGAICVGLLLIKLFS